MTFDLFNRQALATANARITQLETELAAATNVTTPAVPVTPKPAASSIEKTKPSKPVYPRKSWRQKRAAAEANLNRTARNAKKQAEYLAQVAREEAAKAQGEENVPIEIG